MKFFVRQGLKYQSEEIVCSSKIAGTSLENYKQESPGQAYILKDNFVCSGVG